MLTHDIITMVAEVFIPLWAMTKKGGLLWLPQRVWWDILVTEEQAFIGLYPLYTYSKTKWSLCDIEHVVTLL